MQYKRQFAVGGVFATAALAVVGVAIALGGQPVEQPTPRRAGQVEQDSSTPTSPPTTSDTPPSTTPSQDDPVADDAPVNQPADQPADVPSPGVPYDSDGGTVVPNPTNMAPGELAPRPPTQNPVEPPPPPADPPVPPSEATGPAAG